MWVGLSKGLRDTLGYVLGALTESSEASCRRGRYDKHSWSNCSNLCPSRTGPPTLDAFPALDWSMMNAHLLQMLWNFLVQKFPTAPGKVMEDSVLQSHIDQHQVEVGGPGCCSWKRICFHLYWAVKNAVEGCPDVVKSITPLQVKMGEQCLYRLGKEEKHSEHCGTGGRGLLKLKSWYTPLTMSQPKAFTYPCSQVC